MSLFDHVLALSFLIVAAIVGIGGESPTFGMVCVACALIVARTGKR